MNDAAPTLTPQARLDSEADRPNPVDTPLVPQAVLWDFDGTLADTEPLWIGAEFAVIEGELGAPWSMEHAERLVGSDLIEAAAYMLDTIGRTDLEPAWLVERILRRVVDAVTSSEDMAWRPGALELLAALRAAGIPCALVSASYRVLLDAVLERLPAGTFVVSVAGDEVTSGKPHPEPYQKACALLGLEPADCLVLEDSITGAQAGNAAGSVVVGIPNIVDIPPAPRRVIMASLADLDVTSLSTIYASVTRGR
ncbi:MAG: HAD family phosphatase [Microlunatus sp.]